VTTEVVKSIHKTAPGAAIAFNTRPEGHGRGRRPLGGGKSRVGRRLNGLCPADAQLPPPETRDKIPVATPSACEVHRQWIDSQLVLGRNATSSYQCCWLLRRAPASLDSSRSAIRFLPVLPRNPGFPISADRAKLEKRLGPGTPTQLSPVPVNA
jgi:hypothetical protein